MRSCVRPLEQQHTRGRAAAGGDDGRPRVVHLALTGLVAQLCHRLVDEPEAMRAALGELAAVRVDREVTIEGDAPAAVQPLVGLSEVAEAEPLDPRDRVEREAVVDQGEVDVAAAAGSCGSTNARPGR